VIDGSGTVVHVIPKVSPRTHDDEVLGVLERLAVAYGRVRTKGMMLGNARIRGQRFSVGGVLSTGGRGRVSGRLRGERASGTLSRWGDTASGTACRVRVVRWHAQVVQDRASRA
jgi:hypothetical protein